MDWRGTHFHFKSLVAQFSQVGLDRFEAKIRGKVHTLQQVAGVAHIVIENERQAVLEESKVKTGLKGVTLFPFQGSVHQRAVVESRVPVVVCQLIIHTIDIEITDTAHVSIATVTDTRLDVADDLRQFGSFPEVFFHHVPA